MAYASVHCCFACAAMVLIVFPCIAEGTCTVNESDCKPLPQAVSPGMLDIAMGYEVAYAPLDDSELLRRVGFNQSVWDTECEGYDVSSLKDLIVVTRTGTRKPRSEWYLKYVHPLVAQLKAASANLTKELREWTLQAGSNQTFSLDDGMRESPAAMEQLEAQGSGVWAEFFLMKGLLDHGPYTWAVLAPWSMELASGSESQQQACNAFQQGFYNGLGALQARLVGSPTSELPYGMHAPLNRRPAWNESNTREAPWLLRKKWCSRFIREQVRQDEITSAMLNNLSQRLTEIVKLHTGFEIKGNASLGFIYACRAEYARSAANARFYLPCRLISEILDVLPPLEKVAAWRTTGSAAKSVALAALGRLTDIIRNSREKLPRLHVWCTDGVLLAGLVTLLNLLQDHRKPLPSVKSLPSVVSPAASRLIIATTTSGSLCFHHNGKPLGVIRDVESWLEAMDSSIAEYDDGIECNE